MEFLIGSSLRFGWEAFKKRPWVFLGATVIILLAYFVVGFITNGVDQALSGVAGQPTLIGTVLGVALGTFISMGATAFYLSAHDNPDTVELSALWHPRPFWKYLAAYILVWFGIIIGLILLIVPGVIFGLMFIFTTFIVVDRELGPIEAMKESYRITRGHKWDLLGLVYVLIIVAVLGLVALVVGLLVSIPVCTLALVHAYRVLSAGRGPALPLNVALAEP